MNAERILTLYDRKPDLTLQRLSRLSGWSISDLKALLLD